MAHAVDDSSINIVLGISIIHYIMFDYDSFIFQIRVTILYTNPMTKVLSLSELLHLVNPHLSPIHLFGSITLGAVIDRAVVTKVVARRGVHLVLPEEIAAFAGVRLPFSQILNKTEIKQSSVSVADFGIKR